MLKKHFSAYIAFFFSACCFLFWVISIFMNRNYFEKLAYESIFLYEGKQVLSLLLLFLIGFLFLKPIQKKMTCDWILLFSFPAGLCIWALTSLFLLLVGIPYTLFTTLVGIAGELAAVWFFSLRKISFQTLFSSKDYLSSLPLAFFLCGILFFVSSGFIYVFVSYDSYFYFTNYGNTLSIVQNYADIVGENSFTLTNISQFLPLLNSYTAFWGLDQCFQVQAFLTCNIIAAFFIALYQYSCGFTAKRKALLYSILFTLLLTFSTSFITISTWVLANMYCMAYIFFFFLAIHLLFQHPDWKKDADFLISISFLSLTLLRKDGILFVAFLLICLCSINSFSKKRLALLFFPSVLAECWWLFYVRIILNAGVTQATYTSIANNKNIFFVSCIIAGSYLYIFIIHDLFQAFQNRLPFITEYLILFAGMFLLLIYSFIKKADIIIDNVDFTIRNMIRFPSSWGISAIFFAVLLVFVFAVELKLDFYHFLWMGYAFLNFVSYCIVDNKSFWVNWDDSYNRVLLQIVPVFLFIIAQKLLVLLQSDTPD